MALQSNIIQDVEVGFWLRLKILLVVPGLGQVKVFMQNMSGDAQGGKLKVTNQAQTQIFADFRWSFQILPVSRRQHLGNPTFCRNPEFCSKIVKEETRTSAQSPDPGLHHQH